MTPSRRHPDLQVATRDARVVDDDVGLAAAADHRDRAGEQVPLAVDVDERVARAGGDGRRGRDGAADGGAAATTNRPVSSSSFSCEGDGDRTDEGVALASRRGR